jgi:hypothetical protein
MESLTANQMLDRDATEAQKKMMVDTFQMIRTATDTAFVYEMFWDVMTIAYAIGRVAATEEQIRERLAK